jgi:hypothetical protein
MSIINTSSTKLTDTRNNHYKTREQFFLVSNKFGLFEYAFLKIT